MRTEVSIARGRISLNGGTIRDDGNNNAALSHDGLAADSGHRVDGVEPKLQSATVHASRLALSYDEALDEGLDVDAGGVGLHGDGGGERPSGDPGPVGEWKRSDAEGCPRR